MNNDTPALDAPPITVQSTITTSVSSVVSSKTDRIAVLPLAVCEEGPVFDRQEPNDTNDAAFADWEAPLVWHHQKSYLLVDSFFKGQRALHFAFEKRVPKEVWSKGWHIWYDNAVIHRTKHRDATITGRFAFEELTCGYNADNAEHLRPWTGIVARIRDLRAYYYCCLEYPNKVVLYRRDDRQWTTIGEAQVHIDVFTEYDLTLTMRGDQFFVAFEGEELFRTSDYTFADGWCGIRAGTTSFVTALTIEDHERPTAVPIDRRDRPEPAALPAPHVIGELDLSAHGNLAKTVRHNASIESGHFAHADAPQLLIALNDAPDGSDHMLLDLDGSVRWKTTLPGVDKLLPTPPRDDGGCDLYGVGADELMRIDGRSGKIVAQAPAPLAASGKKPAGGNGPDITADLDGSGRRDHFFITYGANDPDIYAIRPDLSVRWHVTSISGNGHGHHNAACDVDGDGREEIFAGCALLSADGAVLWQQHEITRRLLCPNGGHVDSSVMGFFAGPDSPPSLHLASSSAGHLVCDARTGKLLAVHPQGHAQSVSAGCIVPGSNQVHAICTNRWGNYGVTGIYSAEGTRVSRFSAGFVYQNAKPLNWTGDGTEHLLICDGPGWRGIYDHRGERLIDLDGFVPYDDPFAQRYDRVGVIRTPLRQDDPRDVIILQRGCILRLIAPTTHLAAGTRCYAPCRRTNVSWPGWATL